MNPISRAVQNISSFASRAHASFTSCPRTLGVYGGVRILCGSVQLGDGPQPGPKGHCRMTIRRSTWQTNSLPTEGRGASFSSEDIQSIPGPRRMFGKPHESGRRAPRFAVSAPQGGSPTLLLIRHCHRIKRHLSHPYPGRHSMSLAMPPGCCPHPDHKAAAGKQPLLPNPAPPQSPAAPASRCLRHRGSEYPGSQHVVAVRIHWRTVARLYFTDDEPRTIGSGWAPTA